ncbi:hypothetical protein VP01_2986g5 [Puccinia sorghi]|uniref:Uncharacterized protein n=1 Tax=Puccinia sorghi TaxID=27349 RepID=A0A0L6V1A6_9BASI|nr:hypothetical protein VP01_2986g5 [Puccinia sorghi]
MKGEYHNPESSKRKLFVNLGETKIWPLESSDIQQNHTEVSSKYAPSGSSKKKNGDLISVTAISITTVIIALNISLPNLSNPSRQGLSTYQTRLPTIQYRNPIPKFIYLSYLNPLTGLYFKGNDDIYFVGFWILVCRVGP